MLDSVNIILYYLDTQGCLVTGPLVPHSHIYYLCFLGIFFTSQNSLNTLKKFSLCMHMVQNHFRTLRMAAFFRVAMRLLIASADRAFTDYMEPQNKYYT